MSHEEPVTITLPDLAPMHQAVGKGISAFAHIEMILGMLYATLMFPAPRGLCLLTLDVVRDFGKKKNIVEAVAPNVLTPEEQDEFGSLLAELQSLSRVRNNLAHWQTGYWHPEMPVSSIQFAEEMEVRLYPPNFTRQNPDFSPKVTKQLEDIERFSDTCHKTSYRLAMFEIKLRERLTR